ncbi:MAG: energy transducer TonB [Proteobacteria bacterium]|nr:energy transducer TonB [Pseudomonadota bacterium]
MIAPVRPAPTPRVAARPAPKATPKPAPPAAATAPPADEATGGGDAPPLPLPTAAQLIERSLAIAATGAGLIEEKTVSGQSLSERTLYIKNNTRDLTEMAYAEGVRNRAKRFGELFERDVPSGRVGLDVAVASDGSLANVTITRSSGIEATDAKAVRIIEKAAPFGALPPEIAKKYDVAHIEFTMSIVDDQGFSGGQ